jgi:hypothetical protein
MKLSPNFSLEEMTVSETAARKGINNVPDEATITNLKQLCKYVLEPLRTLIGVPLLVTSGYRSPALNKAIGGAKNSQHILGQAADTHCNKYTVEQLYQLVKKSGLPFDQLIQEFNSWVHISYVPNGRGQCLRAIKVGGKTVYQKD